MGRRGHSATSCGNMLGGPSAHRPGIINQHDVSIVSPRYSSSSVPVLSEPQLISAAARCPEARRGSSARSPPESPRLSKPRCAHASAAECIQPGPQGVCPIRRNAAAWLRAGRRTTRRRRPSYQAPALINRRGARGASPMARETRKTDVPGAAGDAEKFRTALTDDMVEGTRADRGLAMDVAEIVFAGEATLSARAAFPPSPRFVRRHSG